MQTALTVLPEPQVCMCVCVCVCVCVLYMSRRHFNIVVWCAHINLSVLLRHHSFMHPNPNPDPCLSFASKQDVLTHPHRPRRQDRGDRCCRCVVHLILFIYVHYVCISLNWSVCVHSFLTSFSFVSFVCSVRFIHA